MWQGQPLYSEVYLYLHCSDDSANASALQRDVHTVHKQPRCQQAGGEIKFVADHPQQTAFDCHNSANHPIQKQTTCLCMPCIKIMSVNRCKVLKGAEVHCHKQRQGI